MKVLVAEDDPHMRAAILEILESEGYTPIPCADGREALRRYDSDAPDFVLLDIMMPALNGYDVCREIRRKSRTTPVVFLSAKSEEIDRVLGLELGADDFIQKPFGVKELIARVRAVSRRCFATAAESPDKATFTVGDLTVSPAELRARRDGDDGDEPIELSLREVGILRVLNEHAGAVVDRDTLFRACWGGQSYPNSRTLDQHISQLRKKIERDAKAPLIIKTVRGVGYRYDR